MVLDTAIAASALPMFSAWLYYDGPSRLMAHVVALYGDAERRRDARLLLKSLRRPPR